MDMSKVVAAITSPKGLLISSIVSSVAIAATAVVAMDGIRDAVLAKRAGAPKKEIVKGIAKVVPFVVSMAASVASAVASYKAIIGLQVEAANAIGRLSSIAATGVAACADAATKKVEEYATAKETPAPAPESPCPDDGREYNFVETITGQEFRSSYEKLSNRVAEFNQIYAGEYATLNDLLSYLDLREGRIGDTMVFEPNVRDVLLRFHIRWENRNNTPYGLVLWTQDPIPT